jgi:hypothetical protein
MLSGSLDGDFGSLTAFGSRIGNLASPSFMRQVSKEIADEALFQVQKGFVEQRDPYGVPWAPKKFPDGRPVLRGTSGRLERSFVRLYAGPDAVIIGSKAREALFTYGTGIYGPRKQRIFPKKGRALRIPTGMQGRSSSGRFTTKGIFFRSVAGSPRRLTMPLEHRSSSEWGRAFKKRVSALLRARLAGRGGGVL